MNFCCRHEIWWDQRVHWWMWTASGVNRWCRWAISVSKWVSWALKLNGTYPLQVWREIVKVCWWIWKSGETFGNECEVLLIPASETRGSMLVLVCNDDVSTCRDDRTLARDCRVRNMCVRDLWRVCSDIFWDRHCIWREKWDMWDCWGKHEGVEIYTLLDYIRGVEGGAIIIINWAGMIFCSVKVK